MTIARSQQISLDHTPYYHCTARCVRRAFLCGRDRYSGKSFEHRRQWLEDRLILLSKIFAVDLLAYAIMSNHYHVVVRINPLESVAWSDEEVVERWGQIYSVGEGDIAESTIATWRTRLAELSWFMRCINENLARRANREDRCTGRFWEGRFKSQALLDEAALLKCMAYVDLNPIRAELASTPETSEHTSIKSRIEGNDGHLLSFASTRHNGRSTIPFSYEDYLSLVDWTGRALSSDKRGIISGDQPPILARLRLEPDHWIRETQHYGRWYFRAVGSLQSLNQYCEHLGQRWLKGAGQWQAMDA
jgi:REP-associated tyrosine transposase